MPSAILASPQQQSRRKVSCGSNTAVLLCDRVNAARGAERTACFGDQTTSSCHRPTSAWPWASARRRGGGEPAPARLPLGAAAADHGTWPPHPPRRARLVGPRRDPGGGPPPARGG